MKTTQALFHVLALLAAIIPQTLVSAQNTNCDCAKRSLSGLYCGWCAEVISCPSSGTASCLDNAFLCSPTGDCANYGNDANCTTKPYISSLHCGPKGPSPISPPPNATMSSSTPTMPTNNPTGPTSSSGTQPTQTDNAGSARAGIGSGVAIGVLFISQLII